MSIAAKAVQDTLVKKVTSYLEKRLTTIGGAGVEMIATWGGLAIDIGEDLLMDHLKDLEKQDIVAQ